MVSVYHLVYYVYFDNPHGYMYKMYMEFVFKVHFISGLSWSLIAYNVVVNDYRVSATIVRSIIKKTL